ncbi:MAG: hypothetical protein IIV17_06095 [Clostridia bacterium]|nr:hypothetical protein [Clostridia bacterium]
MMNVLVRKMNSLKLLKIEYILGIAFSSIATIGLPIGIFCLAPELLKEPLAWGIVLIGMLFFALVGYGLFVHPYRLYLKLPEVQAEYDDEFLYIHGKKEAKIPLAEITYVHITAELPFLMQEGFLREIIIHLCSEEYGRIDLDIEGFGDYKLYFVPHAKAMEGELFRFFDGVMNNT